MGLFKDLANKAVGFVNDVAGTNMSISKSDGGSSVSENRAKAIAKVAADFYQKTKAQLIAQGVNKRSAETQARQLTNEYIQSTDGQKAIALVEGNLNNGSAVDGSVVKEVLDSAIGTVKEAVNSNVTKLVDKGTGALLNKPVLANAKPFSQTLGAIGSSSLQETTKQFLKKHWYWLLIPFGFVGALVYVTVKSSRKGGKKGKNRF